MTRQTMIACVAGAASAALVSAVVLIVGGAATVAGEEQAPSMDEMMAKYAELAEPGAHHQHLAKSVGTWKTTMKFWMEPGQPPSESAGTMKTEPLLGGRFIQSRYRSEFMGQPFEGIGVDGYDNGANKHVGTWMDSMGTVILTYEGDCAEGGKVLTANMESDNPVTGQHEQSKSVTTWIDDDHWKMEMFMVAPDGSEIKTMELTAERQ